MQQKNYLLLVLTVFVIFVVGQSTINAETYKIGAIWENDSVTCDEIFASAVSKLDESQLDYQVVKINAKDNSQEIKKTLKSWDSGEVDCIYSIGDKSATTAFQVVKNVPVIAFGVSNPEILEIIKNPQAPEGKITAVSCYVAPYKQIRTLITVKPNMQKAGFIYIKGNAGSEKVKQETKKSGQKLGIRVISHGVKTSKDCVKSVKTLKSFLKVDAIVICSNTEIVKATEDIVKAAGQIPVLAYDSTSIDRGALLGWIASNEKMGEAVADYTIKILKENTPIEKLPVVFPEKPIFKINTDTLDKVNINIPEHLLENAEKVKTQTDEQHG